MTTHTQEGQDTTTPALPDLIYLVRPGDDNEELRYSLRSVAANMTGFRNVWIVGTVPSWVRYVCGLPLDPQNEKFLNMNTSLKAAVNHPDVAETVIIFNDDHFVREPVDASRLPVFDLGDTERFVQGLLTKKSISPKNTWLIATRETASWVMARGGSGTCFESHTPMPFKKTELARLMDEYPDLSKLAYPQLYPLAGVGTPSSNCGNSKVASLDSKDFFKKVAQDLPYLSSNDKSFADGMIGGYVRGLFPHPSIFEA